MIWRILSLLWPCLPSGIRDPRQGLHRLVSPLQNQQLDQAEAEHQHRRSPPVKSANPGNAASELADESGQRRRDLFVRVLLDEVARVFDRGHVSVGKSVQPKGVDVGG